MTIPPLLISFLMCLFKRDLIANYFYRIRDKESRVPGFLAEHVLQAIGRPDIEDGLRSVDPKFHENPFTFDLLLDVPVQKRFDSKLLL